jgi:peptidyl-prolyl cis-trans isomerase SurA
MASQKLSDPRPLLLLALLLASLDGTPAAAQVSLAPPGLPLESIVAVINDDVVLVSELDTEVAEVRAQIEQRGGQLPAERLLRRQVLERLVMRSLQLQVAKVIGVQIGDDELDAALAGIAQRNQLSLDQFAEAVAERGLAYADYRENIREEMTLERVRKQEVERRAVVTPREVDQFLASNPQTDDSEYLVSHILIALRGAATPEEIEKNRERAEATWKHVTEKDADFKTTVTAYSDAPDALDGGSLGWRKRVQLPTIFADAIANMQPGEVSKPIRSSAGFHIMRLDEKRSAKPVVIKQVLSRHILIKPDAVRSAEAVKAKLEELRAQIVAGAKFEDLAKANSEDPGSKNEGGKLDWSEPGTFAPEFGAVLETLPVGELSQPFATGFGWHLVEVLERRDQDVTEIVRRNRAGQQLRQRKIEEQGQLWIQRLRDEAYLELRTGP